jgi:hypothetical protein
MSSVVESFSMSQGLSPLLANAVLRQPLGPDPPSARVRMAGRHRQLHNRQHNVEYGRFINPGEDFTPEPPKSEPVAASRRERL